MVGAHLLSPSDSTATASKNSNVKAMWMMLVKLCACTFYGVHTKLNVLRTNLMVSVGLANLVFRNCTHRQRDYSLHDALN